MQQGVNSNHLKYYPSAYGNHITIQLSSNKKVLPWIIDTETTLEEVFDILARYKKNMGHVPQLTIIQGGKP